MRVRQAVRERAVALGLQPGRPDQDRDRRERARAQHADYGGGGDGHASSVSRNGVRNRRSPDVFEDHGPGIPDIELALKDGYTTGGGLGLGLGGAKRLSNEFYDRVAAGRGTRVTIARWKLSGTGIASVSRASQVAEARRATRAHRVELRVQRSRSAGTVAIAVTEVATNLVKHAGGGEIVVAVNARAHGLRGIELVALDRGPRHAEHRRELARRLLDRRHAGERPRRASRAGSRRFDIYSRPERDGVRCVARSG